MKKDSYLEVKAFVEESSKIFNRAVTKRQRWCLDFVTYAYIRGNINEWKEQERLRNYYSELKGEID